MHGARVVEQCVVSIHAPARGATFDRTHTLGAAQCFNPRARTGRDRQIAESSRDLGWFQSTRPHGARRDQAHAAGGLLGVSIHAPAWGATSGRTCSCRAPRFQSTRPHGARPRRWPAWTRHRCFNPRARTGRDLFPSSALAKSRSFQSTRPHGARLCIIAGHGDLGAFQSTRPHGARPRAWYSYTATALFQSTRPHGARPQAAPQLPKFGPCFNPRARTGRDETPKTISARAQSFNPRARTGRDSMAFAPE